MWYSGPYATIPVVVDGIRLYCSTAVVCYLNSTTSNWIHDTRLTIVRVSNRVVGGVCLSVNNKLPGWYDL